LNHLDRVIAFGTIVVAALKGDHRAILANVRELAGDDGEATDGGQDEQPVYSAPVFLNPDPPSELGSCECVALRQQDGQPVIAMRDVRLNRRVNPKQGELGISHYGGGFVSLKWNVDRNGTNVAVMAPRLSGDAVDKSHALVMDSSSGNACVTLTHQLGHGLVLDKDGASTVKSGDGTNYIAVTDDGVQVGAAGGVKMVGGVIAGDSASAKAVALSPEVVAALNDIVSALTSVSTQLKANSVNGSPQGIGIDSEIGTISAAISTLAAAGTATTLKASPL
jgi:hypothetical protein